MALGDKLTAIANAIREKTGKTDKLTLDDMVTEILNISGSSGGGTVATVAVDDVWVTNTTMVEGKTVYEAKPIGNNNKTVATISLSGVHSITLMIKNLSENAYDFTEAFEIDTETPSRNGGKFNAKGTSEWVECVYNTDGGEHTIKVMYSKDSSGGEAPDKGYFYIESYN